MLVRRSETLCVNAKVHVLYTRPHTPERNREGRKIRYLYRVACFPSLVRLKPICHRLCAVKYERKIYIKLKGSLLDVSLIFQASSMLLSSHYELVRDLKLMNHFSTIISPQNVLILVLVLPAGRKSNKFQYEKKGLKRA